MKPISKTYRYALFIWLLSLAWAASTNPCDDAYFQGVKDRPDSTLSQKEVQYKALKEECLAYMDLTPEQRGMNDHMAEKARDAAIKAEMLMVTETMLRVGIILFLSALALLAISSNATAE